MPQCQKCKGIGLTPREKPFVCPYPHPVNITVCMYCENVNKSLHEECPKCFGSGKIKNTNTPTSQKMEKL